MQSQFNQSTLTVCHSVRTVGDLMAISHELSSEITAALLAAKDRSTRELEDLKNTLLIVHSTLQDLTDRARQDHLEAQAAKKPIAKGRSASS
jgi:hypothetical protein